MLCSGGAPRLLVHGAVGQVGTESVAGGNGSAVRGTWNCVDFSGEPGSTEPGSTTVPPLAQLMPLGCADFCYLPSVCGNCKALFRRYFFNTTSHQCEEFIYGGCGGNRNNFKTESECFQACSHAGN